MKAEKRKMASITLRRVIASSRNSILYSRTGGIRLISTSKKNRETATIAEPISESKTENSAIKKNWVSYGFDFSSESADRNAMNATFFASITLCLVGGAFILAYLPDYQMRDWSQREAYIELRRREELGLPLIDANLVDVSKIELPSDEELNDVEIII